VRAGKAGAPPAALEFNRAARNGDFIPVAGAAHRFADCAVRLCVM